MATTSSQSSVGGQSTDNFNIDVGSPLWRHTTRVSQISGDGLYLWKCNYCQSNKGKPFNSSYSQVKLHFMGPAGKGIAMCKGTSGKGMSNAQITSFVKERKEAKEEEEVEITARKRGPLDSAFKMEAGELVDEAIARYLYANGLPFNLVRSPYRRNWWKPSIKPQLIT